MHVLQVHARYREYGGEDGAVEDERALLVGGGHEVRQHIVQNPTGLAQTSRSLMVSVWNRKAAQDLHSLVSSHRPDLVHVHNTWFALSPSILAALKAQGLPVVATLHNFRLLCANGLLFRDGHPCEDCVGRSSKSAILHRCYRRSALLSSVSALSITVHRRLGTWGRYVDRLIVMSEEARSKLIAGGLPAEKLVVRENFAHDPGQRALPPSSSGSVLFVGRLSREKGVELLLSTWQSARPSGLELLVVGDGPSRAELEAMDVANVRFLGIRSPAEVAALMLSARALIFPSLWYEVGTPRVPLEALAAGLPVLASDCVAIAGIIDQSGAGASFARASSADLADKLGMLGDSDYLDSAGRAGRALFESRFDPGRALKRLEAVYEEAIAVGRESDADVAL
jgi:glycosyltransferase involved in cell wall biosynthesis